MLSEEEVTNRKWESGGRCASSRRKKESAGVFPEGSGRENAQLEGLCWPAGGALFLSAGRHPGVHHRGLQLPRRAAGLLEDQGGDPRRERARHLEQGEIRREAQAELPAACRRGPCGREPIRRVAGEEHV